MFKTRDVAKSLSDAKLTHAKIDSPHKPARPQTCQKGKHLRSQRPCLSLQGIVYLGTPITAEAILREMHERPVKTNLCKVTELIIAQLLYLNYESADKPVSLAIA